jgi:hypothetical protein
MPRGYEAELFADTPSALTMLRLFILSACAAAVAFLAHAVFAMFYEKGVFAYVSPLGFAAVAAVFAALVLRQRWSWRLAFTWSCTWVVISLVFPPMPHQFGGHTVLARLLIGFEVLACVAVAVSMRRPAVQSWFRTSRES